MEITKDVQKIKGEGNVYLILKPEPLVIDTGNESERQGIKKEMEEVIPLNKIKYVLLTHLHYDHAGNVEIFPNAQVFASKEAIQNFRESPEDFFFSNISKKTKEKIENAIPYSKEVKGLKVISCPGHTKGSIALIDEKRKLCFSGDTLFKNGIGRTDLPNSLPKEMPETVKNLIKLTKEKELILCPGHDY